MKKSVVQEVAEISLLVLVANFLIQFAWVVPTSETNYLQIETDVIAIDEASPAFIAFDHLKTVFRAGVTDQQGAIPLMVPALVDPVFKVVDLEEEVIDVSAAEVTKVIEAHHSVAHDQSEAAKSYQVVDLPEDTFELPAVYEEATAIQVLFEEEVIETSVMVAGKTPNSQLENPPQQVQDTEWIQNLDRELQRRLLEADRRHQVLSTDWVAPSLNGLIEARIQAVVSNEELESPTKVIPTESGAGIIVQKPDTSRTVASHRPVKTSPSKSQGPTDGHTTTEKPENLLIGGATHILASSGYSAKGHPVPTQSPEMHWPFLNDHIKSKSGHFEIPFTDRLSSGVMRIEERGHWPTLVLGRSGQPTHTKVFSQSMIEALITMVFPGVDPGKEDLSEFSIIYGEVKVNDQDASGKRAQLVNEPDAQAVYFNELFLPDMQLGTTSSNGLFVFVGRGEGPFVVEVEDPEIGLAPQLVYTKPGHVSYVEVRQSRLASIGLEIEDFGLRQTLKVFNYALGEELEATGGLVDIDLPEYSNFNFLEMETEEGLVTRMMVDGVQPRHRVPVLQQSWLEKWDEEFEIISGLTVIYHELEDFEFSLRVNERPFEGDVFYLDEDGYMVEDAVSPGYLVLVNVEPGLLEYAFFEKASDKVISGIGVLAEDVITSISVPSYD